MQEIHVTKYRNVSSTVTLFGGPTCIDCPSKAAIAEGVQGLATAGLHMEKEISLHLDTTCHRCLAEGMVESVGPGNWDIHLLAYADDPDGEPMPADGGVR